jgi:hypothetical protein
MHWSRNFSRAPFRAFLCLFVANRECETGYSIPQRIATKRHYRAKRHQPRIVSTDAHVRAAIAARYIFAEADRIFVPFRGKQGLRIYCPVQPPFITTGSRIDAVDTSAATHRTNRLLFDLLVCCYAGRHSAYRQSAERTLRSPSASECADVQTRPRLGRNDQLEVRESAKTRFRRGEKCENRWFGPA